MAGLETRRRRLYVARKERPQKWQSRFSSAQPETAAVCKLHVRRPGGIMAVAEWQRWKWPWKY